MIENIQLIVFPILVAFAGASDLFTMKIPNRVPILLVAGFVVLAVAMHISLEQWGWHLVGGAVVFAACFVMFFLGWMGGGDAKLASAIALWFGFNETLMVFLALVAIYGMFLTVGLLVFRTIPVLPGPIYRQDWIARLHHCQTGIPYGIAIAAAGLQVYPMTVWFPGIH